MTLRAKLISAFGTTLLLSILVFGYITYATFFNDRLSDKEEVLRVRSEAALLAVENEVGQALGDLLLLPRATAQKGNALLRLVEVTAWPEDATASTVDSGFLQLAKKLTPAEWRQLIVRREGRDYLLWSHRGVGKVRQLVVAEFVKNGLRNLLERHCRLDRALLQVRLHGKVLFSFNGLDASYLKRLSRTRDFLNQPLPQRGRLLAGHNCYLYVPKRDAFGLQLRYLVPTADLLQSAIAFKNRIITALIVIGWIAVWIVLILAYRITRPLGILDQAARDIISYNYETPLELVGGSREVRSLADSFETMRRKIKELVAHDSLTGLYNRRYLMHALTLAVAKCRRVDEPLACLMVDLDHFKAINDRYGHQGGDDVLSEFGRIVAANVRSYDVAARYGGEEFTLVLPDTDRTTALQVAERLRRQVASHRFSSRGERISCTISLGVACLEASDDAGEGLLGRADQALYLAKQRGRNRVAHA